jgi:glycosyltransferase involved in cell wall biosynthesis
MNHSDNDTGQRGSFFIKDGYSSRNEPQYFEDTLVDDSGIVHQPDVYLFAEYLGKKYGCRYIIDIGCGHAQKLLRLKDNFQLIGIDIGKNIEYCRSHYSLGTWIEYDLEQEKGFSLRREIVSDAVIICSDIIEHLRNPSMFLQNLHRLMDDAPVALLTTPERDLVRGAGDIGPPANLSHVREWNMTEFTALLSHRGFHVPFVGLTVNNNRDLQKRTIAAIIFNNNVKQLFSAPADFKVVAIMTAYNEEDIIIPSLLRLNQQGIEVYIIDNWSTDSTFELARQYLGNGVCGIERYPFNGPSEYYSWKELLTRVEEVSNTLNADWIIHHDVDEVRCSPWQNVNLKNGIFHAHNSGFDAIDHTVITFPPTDNHYSPGTSFENYFKYFEFGKRPGHFQQIKAWKKNNSDIQLANFGGHSVQTEGRRVYPYKFLLKHYPVRSQAHGEKKIFAERQSRWSPSERAAGWHTQYDSVQRGDSFIGSSDALEYFDEFSFSARFLFERLSGVGIIRRD